MKNNMIYRFAIPVTITYCIDESDILIETPKDIKKLQKKYDVDLQFIIDEFEYKMDIEQESMNDDDYLGISKEELFGDTVNEHWLQIIDTLSNVYLLNEIDQDDVNKIYIETEKDFNNSNINKVYSNVLIKMNGYDRINSKFIVDVESNKILSDIEIEDIRKFIDHQCSDGWGIKFEEIDLSDCIEKEDRLVFVKTWQKGNDVKYLESFEKK
jgi:hypothetical protein